MTSNIKGTQPPLPNSTRALPLPPSRPNPHTLQPPPRSWPRQTSTSTPNAPVKPPPGDASEPPFKKPKLEGIGGYHSVQAPFEGQSRLEVSASTPNSERPSGSEQQKKSRVLGHPLFPYRPAGEGSPGGPPKFRPLAHERAARKDVVPIKAYVPEPPSYAPRYLENEPADFFPWTGHHSEDLLNESTTKAGFQDKVNGSAHESSTARSSVWSSLKHKSGLQILSSLYISALDQRQAHGTISSSSTFKPPPRVTLTDTKREAWLGDLANPLVPLRRLSRTIPHGIRGKVLLDHCLNKDIPTSRAIWLAKCVGANEIRAFKRKGTGGVFTIGGERKWLKDWTSNIEQFLESIIARCGSPAWKTEINYGLRLASHLCSEHLLDQDHYLDWLIASVEDSDLDRLPIWLLVLQIHQQEILQHRRRGRRLARAVLEHMCLANQHINQELYHPVLQQLVQLSRVIIMSAPDCYLLPNDWTKYQDTLESCSIRDQDDYLQSRFEGLLARNLSLQKYSMRPRKRLKVCPTLQIINSLDTLTTDPNFGKVANQCLRSNNNDDPLIKTCIEWSSSIYRSGRFRTYAAARLLRIWSRSGIELQQPIFDFLAANPDHKAVNRSLLYKLIAMLVSSRHLSVGRYLQWLMARGTLHSVRTDLPDYPCDVGFLFELPLHGLPCHVLNLRETLVSSIQRQFAKIEGMLILSIKSLLSERIPDFFPPIQPFPESQRLAVDYTTISHTIKSDIARWIRNVLVSRLQDSENPPGSKVDDPQSQYSEASHVGIITLDQFQVIQQVLEDMEQFNFLADILNLICDHVKGPVLTAVTDTINSYFDIFNAIGAADELFQKLYNKVEADQGRELEGAFLESLFDLGGRLFGVAEELRRVQREMSARAPRPLAAACSPISDTMIEAVQATEPNFADEMDQMLASGTSMDKQTLTRLFRTLVGHLEKSFDNSSVSVFRFSQLLANLRAFGPKAYDLLLSEQLQIWLGSGIPGTPSVSLIPMICSKMVSLDLILKTVMRNIESTDDQVLQSNLALDTLGFICGACSEKSGSIEYRSYRFFHNVQGIIQRSPLAIGTIIHKAVETYPANASTRERAERQMSSDPLRSLAHSILLHGLSIAAETGSRLDAGVQSAIGVVLHHNGSGYATHSPFRDKVISILHNMSDFNVSFIPLELKAVFTSATISPTDSTAILSSVMIERVVTSPSVGVDLWAHLVSKFPADQASAVRELAESETLAWAMEDHDPPAKERKNSISSLMAIIEATAFCVPVLERSQYVERLTETLTRILGGLRTEGDDEIQRLDVLLRLLIVHQSTIQHPKYNQNLLFQLLDALSLFLVSSLLASQTTLSQRIFDLLCLLADSLSDDTRSRCVHSLRDLHHTNDSRLQYVFGYSDHCETEQLLLISKPSSVAEPHSNGSSVTTSKAYPLRRWEMMQDATPVAMENDTSLSLTLFGTRKSVL